MTAIIAHAKEAETESTEVTKSLPANGDTDVPLNAVVSVELSGPVTPASVNAKTITLSANGQPISASVIDAENGKLAFLTPNTDLQPDTQYPISVSGVKDQPGAPVVAFEASFATALALSAANATQPPVAANSAEQTTAASSVNAPTPSQG